MRNDCSSHLCLASLFPWGLVCGNGEETLMHVIRALTSISKWTYKKAISIDNSPSASTNYLFKALSSVWLIFSQYFFQP